MGQGQHQICDLEGSKSRSLRLWAMLTTRSNGSTRSLSEMVELLQLIANN